LENQSRLSTGAGWVRVILVARSMAAGAEGERHLVHTGPSRIVLQSQKRSGPFRSTSEGEDSVCWGNSAEVGQRSEESDGRVRLRCNLARMAE